MPTLPEPDRTERRDRSITYSWRTPSLDVDTSYTTPELGWEAYATLSITHHNKTFTARLTTIKHKDGAYKFAMFSGVTVLSEPIARYSDKALQAFAQRALVRLASNLDEPSVVAVMGDAILTDDSEVA